MMCFAVVLQCGARQTEGGEEKVRYLAKSNGTSASDMFDSHSVGI